MEEKFRGLIEKTREGYRVNEHIRNAKAFRNPDILEKLVAFFDVRESGTNYPPELYDTQELSKEDFYEKLEEARRKWEERPAQAGREAGVRIGRHAEPCRGGLKRDAQRGGTGAPPPPRWPPSLAYARASGCAGGRR